MQADIFLQELELLVCFFPIVSRRISMTLRNDLFYIYVDSVIVYTVDHRGIEETYQSNHSGIFADGCVVILVNEASNNRVARFIR